MSFRRSKSSPFGLRPRSEDLLPSDDTQAQIISSDCKHFVKSCRLVLQLGKGKIHCAKEHFKAISNDNVVYDVVDSYQSLLNIVTK